MRRYLLPALMISLLLSGCGSAGVQRKIAEQNQRFAAAEALSFTADVTANLGAEVFDCTLACAFAGEAVTVEVLAPESVAGIRARVEDGSVALEYEGLSLGVGTAGLDDITPVGAGPLLIQALRSGFLQRCWTERDGDRALLVAQVYDSDLAALTLRYDGETLTPLHWEVSQDGAVVLRCEIRDFTYN